MIGGDSRYYLRLQGESVYYVISAADAPQVVTLNTGDRVTITYRPQEGASILEATAVTLVSGSSGTGTVDNPTDPIKINPAPGIGDIITDPGDGGRVELPVEPPPRGGPAITAVQKDRASARSFCLSREFSLLPGGSSAFRRHGAIPRKRCL